MNKLGLAGKKRASGPLKVPSVLENGYIVPPTHLELILLDQCNLACRACNHFAPIMPRWVANAESVLKDCRALAKVYRPRQVKILGGEPLLHKDFPAVVQAARSTGLCEHYSLVTNGVLLKRMTESHWDVLDEIIISCYPGHAPSQESLAEIRRETERRGKGLVVTEYPQFREAYSHRATEDQELVDKIFTSCKIANVWGCHAFRDGYLYRCPQSLLVMALDQKEGRALEELDRIAITEEPGFQKKLLEFLNGSVSLKACRRCAGTSGKLVNHENLNRPKWNEDVERPLEDMIDYEWLEKSLLGQGDQDDCKILKLEGQTVQPESRRA